MQVALRTLRDTERDPGWPPLHATPMHPEYPPGRDQTRAVTVRLAILSSGAACPSAVPRHPTCKIGSKRSARRGLPSRLSDNRASGPAFLSPRLLPKPLSSWQKIVVETAPLFVRPMVQPLRTRSPARRAVMRTRPFRMIREVVTHAPLGMRACQPQTAPRPCRLDRFIHSAGAATGAARQRKIRLWAQVRPPVRTNQCDSVSRWEGGR